MATHTVVVLNQGTSFRARPPYAVVKPDDQVKFSNYSGQVVSLTFPSGLFAGKDQLTLSTGSKDTLTVQDVGDGRYPYNGVVNGMPVEGESSPEIIVDR